MIFNPVIALTGTAEGAIKLETAEITINTVNDGAVTVVDGSGKLECMTGINNSIVSPLVITVPKNTLIYASGNNEALYGGGVSLIAQILEGPNTIHSIFKAAGDGYLGFGSGSGGSIG